MTSTCNINATCSYLFYRGDNKCLLSLIHNALAFLPPANEVCEGYVFTPVCHSVHRAVSASVHAGIHTPWEQTSPQEQTPATPSADTPRSRHPPEPQSRHPPEQTAPSRANNAPKEKTPPEQTPPPPRADTPPQSRHPRRADTPPCAVHAGRYGQQAGGTHPTGMHTS